LGLFAGWFAAGVAQALPIAQEWFVPQPEAQIRQDYLVLAPNTNTVTDSVVAITIPIPGTRIVLDHWEDGYETDLGNPGQTASQIWGDGNNSNGKPPGYANDPASFTAGSVIIMRNLVPLPRNASTILYDGRDRFGATYGIVMTRAAWFTTPGPLLANSVEVRAVPDWGNSFLLPVGEDVIFPTPLTNSMFEHCSAYIMAAQNGTQVQIDLDGNGSVDSTITLNQGESHLVNAGIKKGAAINTSKPVQVMQFYGDIGANYEARGANVPPLDKWSDDYYAPVGTASDGDETYIFLHNPNASAITIDYTTKLGSGSFSIPGKGTYQYLMPQDSAARFTSADGSSFWGIGTVGARPTANNVHDWGYALVPKDFLSTEVVVGWGAGSEDGTQNGNPVWVTAAGTTRIYVDYNGDRNGPETDPNGGKYDLALDVTPLTISRIYEPDKDQSAIRLYTLNGTLITAAWGQDPATAGPARPYLDLGNTTPNFPVPVMTKVSSLAVDNAPAGLSVGDVLEYTVSLNNKSLFSLSSVPVLDVLPAEVTYIASSTTRDGSAVADSGVTLFPLDESGLVVPILPARLSTVIKFRVTITTSGTIRNTAKLLGYTGVEGSDTIVVPNGGGPNACTLRLTNSSGTEVNYQPGDGIYITVTDPDSNTSITTAEVIVAQVQNSATGDVETVVLTETGVTSGIFRNTGALPSSTSSGLGQNDGTLNVQSGDTITASHVDPAFGDTCPDTALVSAPSLIKQLYLDTDGGDNDTTGDLDRVDPVSSADGTTSKTSLLATPVSSVISAGTTTSTSATGASVSFTHGVNTGTNRLLVVTIGAGTATANPGTAPTVSAVSFATKAMTQIGTAFSGDGARIYIYALKDDPGASYVMPTTGSVQITTSGADSRVEAGATTFTGVDQSTPYGLFASSTATTGTAITVGASSALNEMVVAVAASDQGPSAQGITTTTTGGQVQLWNYSAVSFVSSAASTKPGAVGTVSSAFTSTSTSDWAAGAVSLKPAPGGTGGSVTFVQTPTFAETFSMPSGGTLAVTNYLEVPAGTLSGTPAITATVKNGGTTVATLSSPAATLLSGGPQTVAAVATTSNSSSSIAIGGNLSFAHAPGNGVNRLLLVSVAVGNTTAADTAAPGVVSGVTFGGTAMTQVDVRSVGAVRNYIYSLVNPASASANVVVTVGTKISSVSAAATTFTGVDQATPLGTAAGATGTGTSLDATASSAGGQLVYSSAVVDEGTTNQSITTTAGQTQLAINSGFNFISAASSTKTGAASVAVNYTAANSQQWAVSAVSIRNYAVPAFYRLEWSAALASDVNFTAGQALSLSVGNSGVVGFSVLYDSSTYPSKISLPTNTVIHTDTVAVYDAPYPGGALITTPTVGQTLYVRVAVGDPFGAYDITSLPLVIDGPNASGDVSLTLSDSSVVATTAAVKTYEYVWATGSTEGNFTITATAKEGLENTITSSKSTTVNISSLDLGTPSTTEFTTGHNGPHTLQYAPDETIYVRVVDLDENTNPLVAETITVTITGSGGDMESVNLTETGPDTGIFTGGVPASSSTPGTSGNGTLYALQGSVPVVDYVDNDDSMDTGNDTAVIPAASPGVSVTKTLLFPADGQILVGEIARYRLRVTNTGNSPLNTVQVVDTFSATQLAFDSAIPDRNSTGSGSLTWTNVGPLASGQSVDIIVNFSGLAAANPSINTVNVTTGSGGPTASDTEPVIITRPAVTVIKTLVSPNPGPANKGDNVVFNISVQNTGTTALASVPLEDTFSNADFEFVSATVAPDGIGAGSLLWNDITGAGDLAVSATFNVSVTLKTKGAANPATNHAAVDYAVDVHGDPVPPSGSSAGVETLAATISGYTYQDQGAPGFGGDGALPAVIVKLFTDPDGDGDPSDGTLTAVTSTDAAGYYEFLNLGLGDYVVVEEDLLGYISVADTAGINDNLIPVGIGVLTDYPNNNFLDAIVDPADYGAISGQVRNDIDGDGNLADPDSGLAGAVLTLYTDPNGDGDSSDGFAFGGSVTTSAGGTYSFSNLPPGSYVVVETDPSGFVSTADVSNPNNNQVPVIVIASATSSGNDFLDTDNTAALADIGNQIWSDIDNDGIFDSGETGIDSVVVELYLDSQTPGVDSPYLVTTTSGGGAYQFAGVPAGDYLVYLPASNFNIGQALGSYPLSSTITSATDDGVDHDDNGSQTSSGTAVSSPVITLSAGEADNSKDFGFVPTISLGAITGSVLADIDNDDDGDTPLVGVLLTLKNSAGNDIDSDPATVGVQPTTTVTDSNGDYGFVNVPPGIYQVVESDPSGYHSVTSNTVAPVTVTAGATTADIDFVDEQPGAISGTVLADSDDDGDGDAPLAGVLLRLLDSLGNPVLDGSNQPVTTLTPGDGSYLFTSVVPGEYCVVQDQPTDYASVSDTDGPNDNVIGNVTPIVVTGGQNNGGNNFVEIELGAISGRVFKDSDANGLGDTLFPGVLLTLLDAAGDPVDGDLLTIGVQSVTATTGIDGSYRFDSLFPGNYQVAEAQPANYGSVSDVDGGNPDLIGNITPITVNPGLEVTGRDFVEIELGSISGYVYVGLDPLADVTLTLIDEFGNPVDGDPNTPGIQPISTVTDSLGYYEFAGVAPGKYQVAQAQPYGYDSFGDIDGGDLDIIGDVTQITIAPGQHSQNNNFTETLDTCPDDWDEWKFQHPGETADANPDADAYDNFVEFAFAMPYDKGTGSPWLGSTAWIIRTSALNPDLIEGVFVRPKGAPLNVTYTLQYAAVPGNPTVWQSLAVTPLMVSTVDNGDCTETVTIHDLETLTGLTGGKGVVRIQADLDDNGGADGDIDHTSHTETEGWTVTGLEICCRTYNNPYQRESAFTGTVTGVSGQDLTFAANDNLDTLLASGGAYYMEVTSGDNEGQRFDIVSSGGNLITLANDSDLNAANAPFSTLTGAPPVNLAGDGIAVHRHGTLDDTFPPEGFGASDSQATADQVQIFAGGAWTIYWLYNENDADPLTSRWVDAADSGMPDMGTTVIPPGQGAFFNNRTNVTSLLAYGEIRTNDFIRPHAPGNNLVGGGYPVDQSANGLQGRAMSLATGFFGSTNFKTADSIFVWKADATIGAPGYDTYYLLGGVPSQPALTKWIKVGDSSILSRDAEILCLGNRCVFTRTLNALPGYTVANPWTP
jgi:uncharacterized repeat protein (TIGR01451 family)